MAFERITQKDWYKILGAKPSDSPGELKRKYQRLALLYHPDKQKADVPAGEVEERVQRFIEIDQAWKILGNEETKKEYDLQQREDNLTKEWPLHAQVYLEDMSWNEGMENLQDHFSPTSLFVERIHLSGFSQNISCIFLLFL
nr:dnaJ homolog subfamily C member 24 isoform X3 [Anser cygnoides]